MTQKTIVTNLRDALRAAIWYPGNQWQKDARFYQDAWNTATGLSHYTPYHPSWWARALAALSPLKSWPANVTCAWNLRGALADAGWPTGADVLSVNATAIGTMSGPTDQALRALAHGRRPSGPKTNAFARNIEGDLRVVTVDRHMCRAAGFNTDSPNTTIYNDVAFAVETLAIEYGLFPAETQAIIWAQWRRQKGLK